jgi:hypothetical protein
MIKRLFSLFQVYSQIYLNLPTDDRHFGYKQKFLENTLEQQKNNLLKKKLTCHSGQVG